MRSIIERPAYWTLVAIAACGIGACGIGWGGGRVEMAPAQAEFASPGFTDTPSGSGLITHFHEDTASKKTRVIVIDPVNKQMAVYHVDFESGVTQLKSARNLTIDLQVQQYNSDTPNPTDMQKMLQRN